MGLVQTKIILSNPRNKDLRPIEVKALADTEALHLCIPEHVKIQLELEELDIREVTTADGKKHRCSYVGPIAIKFENRGCFTSTLVFGEEVILRAVPMEDMDIIVSPARQTVIVNPESPNIATSVVKSFRG